MCAITGRCRGRDARLGFFFEGDIGPCVALGIGVGAGLSSLFLRKRQFLSVILPDL